MHAFVALQKIEYFQLYYNVTHSYDENRFEKIHVSKVPNLIKCCQMMVNDMCCQLFVNFDKFGKFYKCQICLIFAKIFGRHLANVCRKKPLHLHFLHSPSIHRSWAEPAEHHHGARVTPERVLQQARELRVAVRDKRCFPVHECGDDIPQGGPLSESIEQQRLGDSFSSIL